MSPGTGLLHVRETIMSRRPNVPCAGCCGKLLWGGGTGSLPAGERTCRDCRSAATPHQTRTCATCGVSYVSGSKACGCVYQPPPPRTCTEPRCDRKYDCRGLCKYHYSKVYGVEKRKARERAKTHLRKTVGRYTDVTPEYERALRDKAKRCPMAGCGVRFVKEPYKPASKELDHMVPLVMGGTHTVGNVRIICRRCNVRRPYDGSDYLGPVTLWAQEPGFTPPRSRSSSSTRCEHGMPTYHRCYDCRPRQQPQTCECGERIWNGRCWTCNPNHPDRNPTYIPAAQLTYEQKQERTRKAAQMRAEGISWWEIADALGFGRESSALQAVRDYRGVVVSDVA